MSDEALLAGFRRIAEGPGGPAIYVERETLKKLVSLVDRGNKLRTMAEELYVTKTYNLFDNDAERVLSYLLDVEE